MDQGQTSPISNPLATPLSASAGGRIDTISLSAILQQAVIAGASDIHFTPTAGEVQLRFRVGVELRDIGVLSKAQFQSLDRNTRQYAGISIISDQEVTGDFELDIDATTYQVHVEIMPTVHGDNLLLSLHTAGEVTSPLARIGLNRDEQAIVEEFLTRDRGLLLVIGPAKTGKTTTLYSVISAIDTKQTPVTTLELDIRSQLIGISQNKVNSEHGSSLAEGLKLLISQGKRTIMLGQITDGATAITAIDAATSEHQIIAGMFGDTIGEVINYFRGFKVEPFMIASTISVIINQRLLRLLCPYCKQVYTPGADEVAFLRQNFDIETAVKNSPQVDAFKTYEPVDMDTPPPEPTPQPITQLAPPSAPDDEPEPVMPSANDPVLDPVHSHPLDHKVIPAPPASTLLGHSILERITQDPDILNRGLDGPTTPPPPAPDPGDNVNPMTDDTQTEAVGPVNAAEQALVNSVASTTAAKTAAEAIANDQPLPINEVVDEPETPSEPDIPEAKTPPINYIINHLKLFRAVGCDHCQGSGYAGVGGIFEVMKMNEKIGEVILGGGDSFKIQQAAEQSGLISLRMAAIKKVLDGTTSVEEISRILALINQGVGILT